ncbi:MAG TPA: DUF992 domain-containing protein, partial [Propylenella sp.]
MVRMLIAVALAALASGPARAQVRVEIGLLDCVVAGGAGFIIGSTKDLSCTFHPAGG